MSSGVMADRGGPAGTELGQLCRAPYVPVHSTMGNLRVYPSPATPSPEAARLERGPGREKMARPGLGALASQLGKVSSHGHPLLKL